MKSYKRDKGTILFVSDLDFSITGNQTLINVIIGTVRNGYKVHLLSSSPKPKNSISSSWLPKDVKDNIKVYRFNTLIRNFSKVLSKLNIKRINLKFEPNNKQKANFIFKYDTEYTPFSYYPAISFISFFLGGLVPIFCLCRKNSYSKICGYEPRGILLGFVIAKFLKLDFYKRFQGIILFPDLNNINRLFKKYFFYSLSVKVPATITFMGNDGTFGDKVLDWFGIPKEKYKFRINGYDNKIISKNIDVEGVIEKYKIKKNHIILLSVSRIEYWKRVDRIIYAFASAKKVCSDLKYIVVGGGADIDRLKSLSVILGIEKDIIFTDRKSHDEVSAFMKRADIFASCYEHSNMANPVIEACLLGKAILSIDDGTTKDILLNNYNSLLADKNNIIGDLTSNLIKLYLSKDLREMLSLNSLKIAKKKLISWEDRMKLENNDI